MNFSSDLKDGEVLLRVLHSIAPNVAPKDLWDTITDPTERAQKILEFADALGKASLALCSILIILILHL